MYNFIYIKMTDKMKSLLTSKKRKNESIQKEERVSDKERKVAIFRKDSIIVIYVKKVYDLFYILESLNMPYYFNSGKKLYFNYYIFFGQRKEIKFFMKVILLIKYHMILF